MLLLRCGSFVSVCIDSSSVSFSLAVSVSFSSPVSWFSCFTQFQCTSFFFISRTMVHLFHSVSLYRFPFHLPRRGSSVSLFHSFSSSLTSRVSDPPGLTNARVPVSGCSSQGLPGRRVSARLSLPSAVTAAALRPPGSERDMGL